MGANWGFYNSPNAWPYTNFHELNLDWILEKLKEQETDTTTIRQAIDATNDRIDQTNTNVSNLSTQNLATLQVALKGRAVYNILPNSYFVNPVNQRGQKSYHGNGYTIDRWILFSPNNSATLSINNGYISLNGGGEVCTLSCRFPKGVLDPNKQYTTLVCDTLGNISSANLIFSLPDYDFFEFSAVAGETRNIIWAALYEGAYTESTKPNYVPKGYAVELADCQLYFERLGAADSETLGTVAFARSGAKSVIISMQYQPKRVGKPTLVFGDVSQYRLLLMDAVNASVFSANQISSFDEIMVQSPFSSFRVTMSNPLDRDCWVALQRVDGSDGAYIDVNADL